ncbi:hypothetical protein AB0D54_38335 [Streptomyces xanthophaeus]|uniref:hypothetical protein n=1 Tax=Streptomyces xanthophaeus TaxID=67385 RepID=UPI00344A7A84
MRCLGAAAGSDFADNGMYCTGPTVDASNFNPLDHRLFSSEHGSQAVAVYNAVR